MIEFVLEWPDSALLPNARKRHWRDKQPFKEAAREMAFTNAFNSGLQIGQGKLSARLLFNSPDNIRRDLDNLLSSMKPSIDGVCLALGIDDAKIVCYTVERGELHPGGRVILQLTEL